ncbi:MAG: hypothetical protein HKN21_05535 [Candidatus Eisenbacteria bacterium]|uniref:Right handed beta helix domain-containing protein n=1 Tax=Eiseniibacteriota bacterium TaxID=2212470 RepID=A0A7Y2H202_UNCEI|nr:hypothetical protein [Candidatus Eisenbacteria bacterium]
MSIKNTLSATILIFLLASVAAPYAQGLTRRVPSEFASIQTAINASSVGDTVLVAPGDYPRGIQVDQAITVAGEIGGGIVRLAGASGSSAKLINFTFTTDLGSETVLVEAQNNLEIQSCRFEGIAIGVSLADAVEGVLVEDCFFDRQIRGVEIKGLASLTIQGSEFEACQFAVAVDGDGDCPTGPAGPADPCAGGCPAIEIDDTEIRNCEVGILVESPHRLIIDRLMLRDVPTGISAQHCELALSNSEFIGGSEGDTGINGIGLAGVVEDCSFTGFETAIKVGDGDCPTHSSLVLGGSLSQGNSFLNNTTHLRLEQDEPLLAELNYWGTTVCETVQAKIVGQQVARIADSQFLFFIECTVPTTPARWGSIKKLGLGQ